MIYIRLTPILLYTSSPFFSHLSPPFSYSSSPSCSVTSGGQAGLQVTPASAGWLSVKLREHIKIQIYSLHLSKDQTNEHDNENWRRKKTKCLPTLLLPMIQLCTATLWYRTTIVIVARGIIVATRDGTTGTAEEEEEEEEVLNIRWGGVNCFSLCKHWTCAR